MTTSLIVEKVVHFRGRGRRVPHRQPPPAEPPAPGRPVPRIARLLALALRCDALVQSGHVKNFAALARLAHLTRARVSQIVNLLHLAADIQEEILFLEHSRRGRGTILLAHLQPIAAIPDWATQRRHWQRLLRRVVHKVDVKNWR